MNVLDLFSGIGGFSLGLERAGMRTVAFCETDEFCRAVLTKHWPNVPILEDVRTLSGVQLRRRHRVLERIHVICGGFPCQPFSVAGKQKGKQDDRHLWPFMFKAIDEFRPDWVIGENVAGFIPMALDEVLFDLESIGYETSTFVLPACAVDALHRRDRVWIIARNANEHGESISAFDAEMEELRSVVANSDGNGLREQSELVTECGGSPLPRPACENDADTSAMQRRAIQRNEPDGTLPSDGDAANAAGSGWSERDSNAGRRGERTRETQERSGFTDRCRWLPEPDVGRVAHGIPRRVDRLRSLGNAVVPQVVEEIGRAIMSIENAKR